MACSASTVSDKPSGGRGGVWSAVALCLLCLPGCGSDPGVQEDEVTVDLRQIARAYEVVLVQSNKPPSDVEQVRSTLSELHLAKIVGDPVEVLVSSRDGQPYVIIPGARLGDDSSAGILAYEKHGVAGKRYVLMMSRDVRMLSDDEFAKASFVMGHKPESQ